MTFDGSTNINIAKRITDSTLALKAKRLTKLYAREFSVDEIVSFYKLLKQTVDTGGKIFFHKGRDYVAYQERTFTVLDGELMAVMLSAVSAEDVNKLNVLQTQEEELILKFYKGDRIERSFWSDRNRILYMALCLQYYLDAHNIKNIIPVTDMSEEIMYMVYGICDFQIGYGDKESTVALRVSDLIDEEINVRVPLDISDLFIFSKRRRYNSII